MRLLGIYAHPDDETYTLGGCMARYTDDGHEVTIVTFTRGEAGGITPGSGATRETLADVREAELREACRIVGCTDVRIVGTADGGTEVTEEGIAFVLDVIRELRPDVVVTMEPGGITSHPDHVAVHTMTVDAAARAAAEGLSPRVYLAALPQSVVEWWMTYDGSSYDPSNPLSPKGAPDATIACTVDVSPVLTRKLDALRAHLTQSQEFIGTLPQPLVERLMSTEWFQRAMPPSREGEPAETDLFSASR